MKAWQDYRPHVCWLHVSISDNVLTDQTVNIDIFNVFVNRADF